MSLGMVSRLGPAKVRFLIEGVAQVRANNRVLEIFGGTGLSTVLLAKRLSRPNRLTSVDLSYGLEGFASDPKANYEALAGQYGLRRPERPQFVRADARALPFEDGSFDYVLAPDSPRTRFEGTGEEWGLGVEEQKELFLGAAEEAKRVLRPGGVFAATAPQSWCEALGARVILAASRRLGFRDCADPVVYCRLRA